MALLVALPAAAPAQDDVQNALRTAIEGLGATHNAAYFPALLPPPAGLPFGATAYSTNLSLKHLPPLLEPPADRLVYPNSVDRCSYTFIHPRAPEEERKDYLGLVTEFPGDWGELGAPDVFHVNTDVRVSVLYDGAPISGAVTLPVGRNTVRWRADTLLTPVLDYPPYGLFGAKGAQDKARSGAVAARTPAARQAALEVLLQVTRNAIKEGARAGAGWELLDGIPTPTAGPPVRSEATQSFGVIDLFPPSLSTSEPATSVEATEVGGEFLSRHIERLRQTLAVSDECGREVDVHHSGPAFMPVGQDSTITWTAADRGPNEDGLNNVTTITQTVRVRDTMPPLLLPPAGLVVETGAASTAVELGRAGVFDLADVRVTVGNDAPASYARDTRTLVTWHAEDASGNASTANQWITVKRTGSNTAPDATGGPFSAVSFEPTQIELIGHDADFLSGRYDQLSFSITDRPEHGFFVAPLFPYFIEDHRVENEFGLDPIALHEHLRAMCQAGQPLPSDFIANPRYITVDDDGVTYVADQYYRCVQLELVLTDRIALFRPGADEELEFVAQIDSGAPNRSLHIAPDGRLWYVLEVGGSSIGLVNRLSADLATRSVYNVNPVGIADPRQRNAPDAVVTDPGYYHLLDDDPYSVVVDGQGVLYVTDGRYLYAYDSENVNANGGPQFLDAIAGPDFEFPGPRNYKDLALDSEGNLYVSDSEHDRVWKFSPSTLIGGGAPGAQFTRGELIGWMGRCSSNLTAVVACDVESERSFGYACTAGLCGVAQTAGTAPGQFDQPLGIAMDPKDVLYVTDFLNLRVQRFTPDGFFAGEAVSECDGTCFVLGDFGRPQDVSVNSNWFYVLDTEKDLLHVFETTPVTNVDDQTGSPTQRAFVTYQSDNNYDGPDRFSFVVSDGLAESPSATVNLSVTRSFRAPHSDPDLRFSGDEDNVIDVVLSGSDPDTWDRGMLTFEVVEQPGHGTLSGTPPNLAYTPAENFHGEDTFGFVTRDGVLESAPAVATVAVEPVNDAPALAIPEEQRDVAAGRAFELTMTVELADADPEDRHHVVVEWGDGRRSVASDDPEAPVHLSEASDGRAFLTARGVYTANGVYDFTACATDRPGSPIEVCDEAEVSAIAATTVTVSDMADLVLHVDDSLPKEVEVVDPVSGMAIERSLPIVDGEVVTFTVSVLNRRSDEGGGLDATNVVVELTPDPRMQVFPGIPCEAADGVLRCALGNMAPQTQSSFTVDAITDGSVFEESRMALFVRARADQQDPSGANVAAREVTVLVNPEGDADGDGVRNGEDAFPGDAAESVDTDGDEIGNNADRDDDGDAMSDWWEARHGLDPLAADAGGDPDGDGLTNLNEAMLGSHPRRADTDRDAAGDAEDGCPAVFDRNQYDTNGDGLGDVCDPSAFTAAAALPDLDGDGTADLVLLWSDESGQLQAFVRSGADGSLIRSMALFDPAWAPSGFAAGDGLTPGGGASIAALATNIDGTLAVEVRDALSGTRIGRHAFHDPDWFAVGLALGDGFAAVLAEDAGGRAALMWRDAATGALAGKTLVLEADERPVAVAWLTGVGLAVLAERADGSSLVELRDVMDGGVIRRMEALGPSLTAERLVAIRPDADDPGAAAAALPLLAVQGSAADGAGAVLVLDALAGTAVTSIAATESPELVLALAVVPGGGSLAVLASDPGGNITVRVFSLDDGAPLTDSFAFLAADQAPRGLFVSPGTTPRLTVLASDDRGDVHAEQRDAESGEFIQDIRAQEPGNPPPPPPPPPPPGGGGNGGGGGGGAAGIGSLLVLLGLAARKCRSLLDSGSPQPDTNTQLIELDHDAAVTAHRLERTPLVAPVDTCRSRRILRAPMKTLRDKLFLHSAGNEPRIDGCATRLRGIRTPVASWHTPVTLATDECIGLPYEAPMS